MFEQSDLEDLVEQAIAEFSDLSDFIWKMPELLTLLRNLEQNKLVSYFPNAAFDDDQRIAKQIRYRLEFDKLDLTFPHYMATSSLYGAASLLEKFCFMLCRRIQQKTGTDLGAVRGSGIDKAFKFFRMAGINPNAVSLHAQVQAALKIRNCLLHASGVLPWSKEPAEIERIVASGEFLSKEHIVRRKSVGRDLNEVQIVECPFGLMVRSTHEYSHICVYYFREYFLSLCSLVVRVESSLANENS